MQISDSKTAKYAVLFKKYRTEIATLLFLSQ